ncbi:hypothetical protein AVEN_244545-1 [Araneus ventricosus]|uniref:Peptidase aspartic putative domain-containing protein n=1 Tax=Araneus ventricosus TaxID=182803 RepID=A0A4Y2REB3_ARAVE|nr:hypothetical protein AVEN_244545-1 [Araneus ventricosus]
MKKVLEMNITLTDVCEKSQPVQVLIGADLFGKFLTGQRRVLPCGLVAIETSLRWTWCGKVPENRVTSSDAMLVTSLFVKDRDILDLWKLDSIGIKDPIEKLSKKKREDLTKEHFLQSVRRLESTTKKLFNENLYDAYEGKWLHEGIIEEVPVNETILSGYYLLHRPVLIESSTTPIRPVFDAYVRLKGHPSLNESLHSGPNLIELIPDILL